MRRRRSIFIGALLLAATSCGGGTGGSSDASTAMNACAALPDLYTAALATARGCSAGGANQCQVMVRLDLLCGCQTYVNDATIPNELYAEWQAQHCAMDPAFQETVCATGCRQEVPRTCVAGDSGAICEELAE